MAQEKIPKKAEFDDEMIEYIKSDLLDIAQESAKEEDIKTIIRALRYIIFLEEQGTEVAKDALGRS